MKYVQKTIAEGCSCPHCGLNDFISSTNEPNVDENLVTLDMYCDSCEGSWKEFYKMYKVDSIDEQGRKVGASPILGHLYSDKKELTCDDCKTTDGVKETICPYIEDILEKRVKAVLCGDCEHERAMDI